MKTTELVFFGIAVLLPFVGGGLLFLFVSRLTKKDATKTDEKK